MSQKIQLKWLIAIVVLALSAAATQAVTIDTVPVGNPGNAVDTRYATPDYPSFGGVDYAYNIGKYEVTAGQYAEFLNAVAATDTYGLYNSGMDDDPFGCQIKRRGTSGSYTYDFGGDAAEERESTASAWANRPVNYVSWGDAARFANWLHNGQPTGVQGLATTEDGAYDLSATQHYYEPDGQTPNTGSDEWDGLNDALASANRKPGATWVIPTDAEWYKAAYHKNDGVTGNYFDYPTSSDSRPSLDLTTPDLGNNATSWHYSHAGIDDEAYLVFFRTIGSPYWRTEVGAHENSDSPYGTFDQGGNVYEWNEDSHPYPSNPARGYRGGGFYADPPPILPVLSYLTMHAEFFFTARPAHETFDVGFRVASVPEPGSITLLLCGLVSLICWRRWR